MVAFRSLDQIILSMLDFGRLVQPDLDLKPGSVARDITVDLPASEISKIYGNLRNISNLQSLASAVGTDLDRQARNYGITRNSGSPASGSVVFTVATLNSDIFIPAGTQVNSRSRVTFRTLSDVSFDSSKSAIYLSNALRIRSDLDLAGITDTYALEIRAECTQSGTAGNIGKFAITQQSVPGISNVTNITSFTGGTGTEDDTAFRARALGIFAGANVGTDLGYINQIKTDTRIQDALTVDPGDPLMTRDGSQIGKDSAGNPVVISEGTGGKVDIYVQGTAVEPFSESYIYKDLSGRFDATDPKNDFILGQRSVNPLLNVQQRRKLLIKAGTLPFQPVDSIVSISGSLSGPNFIEQFTDAQGQVHGNFQLIKDLGAYGGSPFGFDKIHFTSNEITLDREVQSKGPLNSQDPLDFSDVKSIESIVQQILINNENSIVTPSNRAILTLLHVPVTTVSRVQNLTTGERYKIVTQNLDGGTTNTTGRIQIAGSTLPTTTDILQVNYIWEQAFDEFIDYDSLKKPVFTRTVQDSIDWGFANRVEEEQQSVLFDPVDGYHVITNLPISRVINVNVVAIEAVPNVLGKLTVSGAINDVFSVKNSAGQEMFQTLASNGSFSGFQITLPTDTLSQNGDVLTVYYNVVDLYSPAGVPTGSFAGSVIELNNSITTAGATVYVDYVADAGVLIPSTALLDLPAVGQQNQFVVNSTLVGHQPIENLFSGPTLVRNLKYAPTYLKTTLQGITATGRLTIKGWSFTRIDAVVTARRSSLTLDLTDAIKSVLGVTSLPITLYIAKFEELQRVTLANGLISNVDFDYDVLNYELQSAAYSDGTATNNAFLTGTEVLLQPTTSNVEQQPNTGDSLHVVFYVIDTGALENLTVSSSGTAYSKNRYAWIERIAVSSGFVGLSGNLDGTILVESATQPTAATTYDASYAYTAPKQGERIVVNYNYNRLLTDATFNLETVRPITADVLVKAAGTISVDVTVRIIPVANFTQNQQTFIGLVQQAVSNFVTSGGLGSTVDASDIINAIYSVNGVDRVDLFAFNVTGSTGLVRSIVAASNQYFIAGTITVTIGTR